MAVPYRAAPLQTAGRADYRKSSVLRVGALCGSKSALQYEAFPAVPSLRLFLIVFRRIGSKIPYADEMNYAPLGLCVT